MARFKYSGSSVQQKRHNH